MLAVPMLLPLITGCVDTVVFWILHFKKTCRFKSPYRNRNVRIGHVEKCATLRLTHTSVQAATLA